MKKRMIAISIAAVILCLLAWRLCPRSFSGISPVDVDSIIKISGYAGITSFESVEVSSTNYHLDTDQLPAGTLEEILSILNFSRYQPDFRNLLPWGVDSVSGGKDYDGRTVSLFIFQEYDSYMVGFLSSGSLYIDTGSTPGFRIYHPTNRAVFDDLVEYLQENGVKE